ncbi:MAG: YicC/YloC family endoribonuclease [Bacteroidales bacterium]|nr:YicC/YloC family endoribonuclease [Bacteroidales bacterium]
MIRSMTGYGSSCAETPEKKVTVELRSLNSKQSDINTRMPWQYKEKEIEIRARISQGLVRGKADLVIFVDSNDDENLPKLNKTAIKSYYNQLIDVAGELYIENRKELLSIIMKLPETLKSEKQTLSDKEWDQLKSLLDNALLELDRYRLEEGRSIEKDLRERIRNIETSLDDIGRFEEGRISRIKDRISSSLRQLENENTDENRFEQEILYYLEKLDLNEEKVRLKKHCDYFIETIENEEINGKKLGFISQEIGREINTLGSKANDASIQRIVVMMKDELEKIKEQVLNVL